MKDTTRKQIVEMLVDFLLDGNSDHTVFHKIDGIASNDSNFEITIREREGRYTDFRITISEPSSYDLEEDDD